MTSQLNKDTISCITIYFPIQNVIIFLFNQLIISFYLIGTYLGHKISN